MPTTKKQREANRANSKKSTGPKTAEGKNKSSLNGVRHGLTGQVVCMPEEDYQEYKLFTAKLRAHYQPEGALEAQIAQGIADDEWRLNRIRAIEHNIIARGHMTSCGSIDVGHPELHAAMTLANIYFKDPEKWALISLYEQRIHRNIKNSEARLKTLQTERKAALQQAMEEAELLAQLAESKGETYDAAPDFPEFIEKSGFAFSTPEITRRLHRNHRLTEARTLNQTPKNQPPATLRKAA